MYWVGIQPGDVHLNLSSPGWAKHAWSNVYAPWNAGATVLVLNYQRFSASSLLAALGSCQVTTFCAPPTVWRMLIQAELGAADVSSLRECVAAGEPLNPEVIEQVRKAWGSRCGTGSARPRRRRRSGTRRASRCGPARWDGRCRGTPSCWSTRLAGSRAVTGRSAWTCRAAARADDRVPG